MILISFWKLKSRKCMANSKSSKKKKTPSVCEFCETPLPPKTTVFSEPGDDETVCIDCVRRIKRRTNYMGGGVGQF